MPDQRLLMDLLVVMDFVFPAEEQDPKKLKAKCPEDAEAALPAGDLVLVIGVGPFRLRHGTASPLDNGLVKELRTSESSVNGNRSVLASAA